MNGLETEARVFGRYVLGRPISAEAEALYLRALAALAPAIDSRDASIVRYACAHPGAIGALDGALALTCPRSLLRRKLLLMAAVLETQPLYCDDFLPRRRSPLYAIAIAAVAMRAAFETIAGAIVLCWIR